MSSMSKVENLERELMNQQNNYVKDESMVVTQKREVSPLQQEIKL